MMNNEQGDEMIALRMASILGAWILLGTLGAGCAPAPYYESYETVILVPVPVPHPDPPRYPVPIPDPYEPIEVEDSRPAPLPRNEPTGPTKTQEYAQNDRPEKPRIIKPPGNDSRPNRPISRPPRAQNTAASRSGTRR